MMPLHKLLNRIRWDKEFGIGEFEVGYSDHIEQKIIRIPFRRIRFVEGDHFSFQIDNEGGIRFLHWSGSQKTAISFGTGSLKGGYGQYYP
jgi:hypothetical protein